MNKQIQESQPTSPSLIVKMAARYGVDPGKMVDTLKQTAFRQRGTTAVSTEQLMALLIVAEQYGLNPWTKEIYAFPSDGGIVPVVGVDGWLRIINTHPALSSISFEYSDDDIDDPWIACRIARSDRTEPVTVREYMSECRRDTGPWKSHPRRMLRHKVLIQCARIAMGFTGIYDQDEAERIVDVTMRGDHKMQGKPATRRPQAIAAQPAPAPVEADPFEEVRFEPDTAETVEVRSIGTGARTEVQRFVKVPVDLLRAKLQGLPASTESEICDSMGVAKLADIPLERVEQVLAFIESVADKS